MLVWYVVVPGGVGDLILYSRPAVGTATPAAFTTLVIVTLAVLLGQVTAPGVSVIPAGEFNATIVPAETVLGQPLLSVISTV
ncbi:hypothetical protein D3C85_962740 [compost metagenome]